MDPSQNTSPDESAVPNVPPQTPPLDNGASGADPNGLAPAMPPPATSASSWLPPSATTAAAMSGVPATGNGQPAGNNTGTPGQAPSGHINTPAVADDGDVIEKEWVDKAKQIVAQTRQDPYRQTKELHKFKAEYMLKRYNKTIEAVDE